MTTTPRTPLVFAFMVFTLVFTGCSSGNLSVSIGEEIRIGGGTDGSGELVRTTFELDGFDHVDVSHAFDVEITVGDATFVEVVTDDNLVEELDIHVVDNELRIRFADGSSIGSGTFQATVRLPILVGLDTSGASSTDVVGAYGSSQNYESSGASTVTVNGTGVFVEVEASGASTVDLKLEGVTDLEVDVSGASEVDVLQAENVSGDVSGASTITIPAEAVISDVDVSGASSVNRS